MTKEVTRVLMQLKDREILILWMDGHSQALLARIYKVSPTRIRQRLARARRMLHRKSISVDIPLQ